MKFIEQFRRVSSQRYMAEIDGLRFLAILPVVILHFRTAFLRFNPNYSHEDMGNGLGSLIDRFILTGDVGVLVFFAISGFILSLPFAKHHLKNGRKVDLKKYFLKRLTRLEPPYIITLIGFFIVHLYIGTDSFQSLKSSLIASLFYSHNWYFEKWSVINPVAWSLEIEVQFYILVPLLTSLFLVKKSLYRRILIGICLLTFPVLEAFLNIHILSLIKYGQYFLVGFFVADIYLNNEKLFINKNIIDIVGVVSIVSIFIIQLYKVRIFLPLALFNIFIAALYGKRLNKLFSMPFLSIIGGMCYITYLIHFPLAIGLVKVFGGISLGLGFWIDFIFYGIIIIPCMIMISSIAFLYLEKPFMKNDWPIKLWVKVKKLALIKVNVIDK